MPSNNFLANGTINPSVFVKIDSSSNERVIQAAANSDFPIGVSQQGTKNFPTPGGTTYAAQAGDQIQVYGPTDICLLTIGTAGVTAGDSLTSDGNGNGVTASGSQIVGAIALETVGGGGLARVQVTGSHPY
jgi:hypothetical protein